MREIEGGTLGEVLAIIESFLFKKLISLYLK